MIAFSADSGIRRSILHDLDAFPVTYWTWLLHGGVGAATGAFDVVAVLSIHPDETFSFSALLAGN